jgi:predicted DNA-binding transcriptional regulator AlpA
MPDRDRFVRASDIVGAKDIAQRLGLAQPQSVSGPRRRHDDFPQPIAGLGKALVWAWLDVEAWELHRRRLSHPVIRR